MSPNLLLLDKLRKKDLSQPLLNTIMEHLHLSQSQAYRRIKGTVEFSLSEAGILMKTFNIDADEIFKKEQRKNTIDFNAVLSINTTYLDFLTNLNKTIQGVNQLINVNLQYATCLLYTSDAADE